MAVAVTAYLWAYYDKREESEHRLRETQQKLDGLQEEIERYRRATGHLPTDLADLPAVKFYHRFMVDGAGRVVDIWDHPYQYRVEGDGFRTLLPRRRWTARRCSGATPTSIRVPRAGRQNFPPSVNSPSTSRPRASGGAASSPVCVPV